MSTIVDRIRKALALTTSPNEHEAALALERAHELLLKHQLSMASVLATKEQSDVGERDIRIGRKAWQRKLLVTVANHCYCSSMGDIDRSWLVGRRENVAAAIAMFAWVRPQLERLAAEEGDSFFLRGSLVMKARWRRSFLIGAAQRIHDRLKAQRDASESSLAGARALVISHGEANAAFIREKYPGAGQKLVKAKGLDQGAARAGYYWAGGVSLAPPAQQIEANFAEEVPHGYNP